MDTSMSLVRTSLGLQAFREANTQLRPSLFMTLCKGAAYQQATAQAGVV